MLAGCSRILYKCLLRLCLGRDTCGGDFRTLGAPQGMGRCCNSYGLGRSNPCGHGLRVCFESYIPLRLDIQNLSFLVPEMGTYSVPISGSFLLKHRRRFPFLGPKNVPISGTRNCVIFCKKCALICKMCALFWNRTYKNIEAVIVCVSNWGY